MFRIATGNDLDSQGKIKLELKVNATCNWRNFTGKVKLDSQGYFVDGSALRFT